MGRFALDALVKIPSCWPYSLEAILSTRFHAQDPTVDDSGTPSNLQVQPPSHLQYG